MVVLEVSTWCIWDQLTELTCLNIDLTLKFSQKYTTKSIPLEEAVKLIQIAERARQGRLRAMFMKQIFLQEYRAKQARMLGEKVIDMGAAALQIQKVCVVLRELGTSVLTQPETHPRVRGELGKPKSQNPTFNRAGF